MGIRRSNQALTVRGGASRGLSPSLLGGVLWGVLLSVAAGCGRDDEEPPAPRCGDGVVQDGEECDDGNLSDGDECTTRCLEPRCGDGIVQEDEACDDGNFDEHDACLNDCSFAVCGDGVVRRGLEVCDDSNQEDGDGCRTNCALPTCGDGVVQVGEECDDGNLSDSDECTTRCLEPRCGDGIVQGEEACDDGNFDPDDACLNDCSLAYCGDGLVRRGLEACDDGNQDDGDGCRIDCALPTCGDGVVQAGEECDDGDRDDTDDCTHLCLAPRCGDAAVQAEEECDDGNSSDQDTCLNDCTLAVCGDGFLRLGVEYCDDGNQDDGDGCRSDCAATRCGDGVVQDDEQCDDGNDDDGDGCLSTCVLATCGDGVLRGGVEECDDGNRLDGDGCASDCTLPSCGDGLVQSPEACDDGNASNTDACLNTCIRATCGDGFLQPGEACDDGNAADTDACRSDCTAAACGDGTVWAGVEACDDGNTLDGDACRSDCTLPDCGDGVVQEFEGCDDANGDNTDGCLLTCRAFDWCEGFAITAVEPPVICSTGSAPEELVLTAAGRGFLEIEGAGPTVTWDGVEIPAAVVDATCAPVSGALVSARACGSLSVEVPLGDPPPVGDYELVVTNPVTQGCADTAAFSVAPPPTVTGVTPGQVCADLELTLELTGSGLAAGTQVSLVDSVSSASQTATSVTAGDDGTTLQAVWDTGLPAGTYDLLVSNGTGCETTTLAALVVLPRPIIFFIDPPVIYNALDFQATLYVANINGGDVASVETRRVGTSSFQTLSHVYDPSEPSQVQATFPANLVGVDEQFAYEVTLEDANGCPAALNGVTDLTQRVTMADFTVEPPFGGTTTNTPVSVVIDDPTSGEPFQEVPRVYLNPTGGGALARALTSVGFLDETELSALVPAGLAAGTFQVIVVNPDGTVGVSDPPIPGGFTVHGSPPPVIDSITPGSIRVEGSDDAFRTVYVFGRNLAEVTGISLICQDPTGAEATYAGSVLTPITGGLTFLAPSTVTLNSICVVRATNAEGAYGDFSALVALNGAENIPVSEAVESTMTTPRRAPVALVGSLNTTARFLYAIGGDAGAAGSALASVEAIGLSPFGDPKGTFVRRPLDLPQARTLAQGATIGRFLYVIGGDTGAGAVTTGYRAEVLRVEDAPQITGDLTIALDPDGVGPGLWYYRVSAVMDAADADNPGGETLPSEPLPITVPVWAPEDFQITLRWSPVPGAAGYRIYRSPEAGDPLSAAALIGTTSAGDPASTADDVLALTDDGLVAGAAQPRVLGDLGEWIALPALGTARADYGLAVATDPADSSVRHVYALGGVDAAGVELGSFEFLTITLGADGSHTVGSWTAGASAFGAKRSLAGFALNSAVTPMIDPFTATWILAGPGTSPASGAAAYDVSRFQTAAVQAGGQLAAWTGANNQSIDRRSYGAVAVSNQVFLMGGRTAVDLAADRTSGMMLTATGDVTGEIVSINNTPGDLVTAREYVGSVLGSGRIFLVGGNTAGGVTATIESMPW